ncbi:adenosine deaminase 2-A-like [Sitodiplosis mosellana]|uniref:adenosine deaminase 2-A-like n=1 Tax=Sitodiplosis mosellana TaxID=263140 RepID=UPI002444F35C|nr:adenosine deaminase 2-A-like [Sitodiplosis mosellana]
MRSVRILFGVSLFCIHQLTVYSEFPNPPVYPAAVTLIKEHRALVQELKERETILSFGNAEDKNKSQRQKIIDQIINKTIKDGAVQNLETLVNEKLMILKNLAIEEGLKKPDQFLGVHDFTDILVESRETDLHKILIKMPKGANLHAHSTSMSTLQTLLEMPTRKFCGADYENVYVLHNNYDYSDIRGFKVSNQPPTSTEKNLQYSKLKEVMFSNKYGEKGFIDGLKSILTLKSIDKHHGEEAWTAMSKPYAVLNGLLNYAPFLEKIIEKSLEEMMKENVQYVEIRATFGMVYDLKKVLSPEETFQFYKDVCTKFTKKHLASGMPNRGIFAKITFIGPVGPTKEQHEDFFKIYKRLVKKDKEAYPLFLNGFELEGPEDGMSPATPTLDSYVPYIKELDTYLETNENITNMNYYFNAGQTKTYKISDENLYDAVMLAKRIGHAYTLPKHPYLMELAKKRDVCIEVSLTADLATKLNFDLHSHPMSEMLANNVQMVITPKNPAFQDSTMTDDFYLAFVYVAAQEHDLSVLKKLILNSFKYSGMNNEELTEAVEAWVSKYMKWLKETNQTLSATKMKDDRRKLEWLKLERTDFFKDVVTDELREQKYPKNEYPAIKEIINARS